MQPPRGGTADRQRYHVLTTRTPPTRAALISSTGQHPAWISASCAAYFGPFQRLGGIVASNQSPAGQLIQPADPCDTTENSKITPAANYFDSVFVVEMPGGGVYDLMVVPNLQSIIVLSPESGSAPSHYSLELTLGVRAYYAHTWLIISSS